MIIMENTNKTPKGFIEVISLSRVTRGRDDFGTWLTDDIEEVELISLNNIALVRNDGNILLNHPYPSGDYFCRTKHTYEEVKHKIKESTEVNNE